MSNVIPMPIKDQDLLEGVIERVGGLSELLLMFIHNDDTDLQRQDRLALTVLYHGLTEEAEKLTAHVAERRIETAVQPVPLVLQIRQAVTLVGNARNN